MKPKLLIFVLAAAALGTNVHAQPTLNPNNIERIIKEMTLREKAELIVGSIEGTNYFGVPISTGSDPSSRVLVPGAAGQTNLISRLGIPSTVLADGPAGVRINPNRKDEDKTYYATGFPVGISLSSTFNRQCVEEVGMAMGEEVLDYGVDVLLAPGTNIMRSPLCGRNFEYYSEDPVLSGEISAAMTSGVQSNGVGVSIKHFAANNQETNRNENDSRVDQRALREIYLKPFEIAVKKAQPWTIMSSYNKINGTYTQQNWDLLTGILRNEWGFNGIVLTDWTGKRNTTAQICAGNDLMMPGEKRQIDQIIEDFGSGVLKQEDLDACVRRVLEYIVKTPHFKGHHNSDNPDLASHATVSRAAANEGLVLLKNDDNTLPLEVSKCAALFGNASYRFLIDGSGSGHVCTEHTVNMLQGLENVGIQVNEPLKGLYDRYFALQDYKAGFSPLSSMNILSMIGVSYRPGELAIPPYVAKAIASQSDYAIVTIGRKSGEGSDRAIKNDFELSEIEKENLKNICDSFHALGKKVIVLLNVAGVIETVSWRDLPDAILLCWMPGQEGGDAVADALCGKVNPSGRLPITFPIKYSDVPSKDNFPTTAPRKDDGMMGLENILNVPPRVGLNEKNIEYTNYEEGIYVGYRYYTTKDIPTAYPFGYGLSYTNFEYSDLATSSTSKGISVKVKVSNRGPVCGKEVVQVYVRCPSNSLDKPKRELKAFDKTALLSPGESQTFEFFISNYELSSFDIEKSAYTTDAGQYTIEICRDSENPILSSEVALKKSQEYKVNNYLALQDNEN